MLICLIGFSADGNNDDGVTQALGTCLQGTQWQDPPSDRHHRGWKDRRGLLVRIWSIGTAESNNSEDLREWELNGPMFH